MNCCTNRCSIFGTGASILIDDKPNTRNDNYSSLEGYQYPK